MIDDLNALRPRMMSVAYRMLGSVADAEDAAAGLTSLWEPAAERAEETTRTGGAPRDNRAAHAAEVPEETPTTDDTRGASTAATEGRTDSD